MPLSPQAPTVGVFSVKMSFFVSVLCVLCVSVVKMPFSVAVPHRFLLARSCIETALSLLMTHLLGARMSSTPAALWGTYVGHFPPATPPPSLFVPTKREYTTFSM
jgi:hypothetical protein